MNVKERIQLYAAVTAAGFNVVNCKSMETMDGYSWSATLAYGRTKLITAYAYNSGTGGPDGFMQDVVNSERESLIRKFWALPCVADLVRKSKVEFLDFARELDPMSDDDYQSRKAAILSEAPPQNDEELANVLNELSMSKEVVAMLKQDLKKGLCFMRKSRLEDGTWFIAKVPDTPESRSHVQQKLGDECDCFPVDLLVAPTPAATATPKRPRMH